VHVSQVRLRTIMLAELAVNRVLDNPDPQD
jgi:hypothetical protein